MFKTSPAGMHKDEFVMLFGGVYEHSPWIAGKAWELGLTSSHDSPEGLAQLMSGIVNSANTERQLELILAHPDLAGKVVDGWNTVKGNSDYEDVNGHGTMVAGVAAALSNNRLGIAGVSWRSDIIVVRVII